MVSKALDVVRGAPGVASMALDCGIDDTGLVCGHPWLHMAYCFGVARSI
jgi:hypothetical protein